MKNNRIICLLFFLLAAGFATGQNTSYRISMQGLGELKLGMSQAAIEKLFNQKINLPNQYDTLSYSNWDTARLIYKSIPVQLEFSKIYTGPDVFHMRLVGIRSSSPLCKTVSGIGVGSDKSQIIMAYNNNNISIQPGYANYFVTEEGKGRSTLSVMDDPAGFFEKKDAFTMVFYLMNNKVESFELKAALKD